MNRPEYGMGEKPQPFEFDSEQPTQIQTQLDARPDVFGVLARGFLERIYIPIAYAVLACAVVAVAVLGFAIYGSSSDFSYDIRLTFTGVEQGQYPDGSRFSVTDIIASRVLEETYVENNIADLGIEPNEFANSFQVTALATNRTAIMQRYEEIFSARDITPAEIAQAQSEMAAQLRADSTGGARVFFSDPSGQIAVDLGTKILTDVVDTWADIAISVRGVLTSDIARPDAALLTAADLAPLEPMNALRDVNGAISRVQGYLDQLRTRPGGRNVEDLATSKDVNTLEAELNRARVQLRQISSTWSKELLDHPSAPRPNVELFSRGVFVDPGASAVEYILALDVLEDNASVVSRNVNAVSQLRGATVAVDPDTGLTVRDIGRLAENFVQYDLADLRSQVILQGITRDAEALRGYFSLQISNLEADAKTLERNTQVLLDAARSGIQTPSTAETANQIAPTATFIPQIDDSFLDRIISLSGQEQNSEFFRDLTERAISLRQRQTSVESRIARLQDYLDRLDPPAGATPERVPSSADIERVTQRISESTNQLGVWSDALFRIAQRLEIAREVFDMLENPENVVFDINYYLRDRSATTLTLENVVDTVREAGQTAEQLGRRIDEESFGRNGRLYRPLSTVNVAETPIVTSLNAGIVLASFAVVFLLVSCFLLLRLGMREFMSKQSR